MKMNLNNLKKADEKAENIFRISTPYYLLPRIHSEDNAKKKVIFWGTCFERFSNDVDFDGYIKKTNECLDYIRRECKNYELFYKPHPAEKDEPGLLNLTSFKIVEDSTVAEIFLWKNLDQIAYSFSASSNAALTAYDFGLNSFLFYKLFRASVGEEKFEVYEQYFRGFPEGLFISDLSSPLKENRVKLNKDEVLEQGVRKLLDEKKGKIWLTITEPALVMVMVAIAKLIKNISPGRPIGLILSQQHRWGAVDADDFKNYFEDIQFLPRIYYSLRPNKIMAAVLLAFKIWNLKINPQDIMVSFMNYPDFSFVENCLISYFKRSKKITFCLSTNFDLMYAFKIADIFRKVDLKPIPASLFFNKILEPVLGLYKTTYLRYKDGKTFSVTRYDKPINEIFDQVYLLCRPT